MSSEIEKVLVLDYGSQYNMLITRRLRECGVYAELVDSERSWSDLAEENPKGVILSGGPASVYEEDAPKLPDGILESGVPILGICYGMQLLCQALGGTVVPGDHREYGPAEVDFEPHSLVGELPARQLCWMSHGDRLEKLPPGFTLIGKTPTAMAAIGHDEKKIYGLQFHPEVSHTRHGKEILKNFLQLAGCAFDWTPAHFVENALDEIHQQVGEGQVFCALSGGVDSSVAAALVHRAIGDRLQCLFVDNGLLRYQEAEEVLKLLAPLGLPIKKLDAQERFLGGLAGVAEPERKRKIIGETFIRVFEGELATHPEVEFLVQGTLYPDIVESGHGGHKKAATIKTHHNVGGLPEDMQLTIVEPLKTLFKDEVRRVGKELGIADEILQRQPFPGPGMAVRVLGPVDAERLATAARADHIARTEIAAWDMDKHPWQYYAALLPVKSVGVMGDGRTYADVVAVRAVHSEDAMTADVAQLDWKLLERIATRIVNEVDGVNRVVYDITPKPPGTIEWE